MSRPVGQVQPAKESTTTKKPGTDRAKIVNWPRHNHLPAKENKVAPAIINRKITKLGAN